MDKLLALLKKLGVAEDKIDSVKDVVEDMLSSASEEAVATEVAGLKKKNAELTKKLKDASPEDAQKLIDANEALTAENTKLKSDTKTLTKERDKAVARGETAEKELNGLAVDRELTDHLTANKVSPELMKGAKALIAGKATVRVEGDKRTVMFGEKASADYVKEWATSDEGKAYVAAALNKGSDAPGNGQGPAATGGKTMTRTAFDAMSAAEKSAFSIGNGTLTDG
jgi:ribosomal protein S20